MSQQREQLYALLEQMRRLRDEVYSEGQATFTQWQAPIERREFVTSALNLACYLALRGRDLRSLEAALMLWGLTLGQGEPDVMRRLDTLIATLGALCGEECQWPDPVVGDKHLHLHDVNTDTVFGTRPERRRTRIMVTLPTEAATDYELVRDWLACGVDCLRINCAHDEPAAWEAMIDHVRRAERETGRAARVAMDLAGPKTRTEAVARPKGMRLKVGDRFLLTPGTPASTAEFPVQASCTLTEIFEQVPAGASMWLDEGRLGAVVERNGPDGMALRVTHAPEGGQKLRPLKSLNFPGTDLQITPLTRKDLDDLDFVAERADMVCYSFVQETSDMVLLQDELARRMAHPERMVVVVKVETARAVRNLPDLMARAASRNPTVVLIARGDLAVEIGYQRLVELQDEILRLCEAAHVPVIWATQVMEQLVQTGRPSRAEMTDAAAAGQAECVLLNKGPYIREAVAMLDELLSRMQAEQSGKTAHLRVLRAWQSHQEA